MQASGSTQKTAERALKKKLAERSYNRAKQSRVVLRLAFALAVRHEILPRNPMAGVELAAELLGHTHPKITIQHYIRRSEMVNSATAEMLDRVFTREQ